MFGRLQTDCGYTPSQIREMTLDDVKRLLTHWERFPPVRALVAGAVGFKPDAVDRRVFTADDFDKMIAESRQGAPPIHP